MYSEEQPGDAATALFIKKLSEEDAGEYRCTATYASNQQLEASVDISVYSEYFQVKNILTFLHWNYFSWDHLGRCSHGTVRQSPGGLQGEVRGES